MYWPEGKTIPRSLLAARYYITVITVNTIQENPAESSVTLLGTQRHVPLALGCFSLGSIQATPASSWLTDQRWIDD